LRFLKTPKEFIVDTASNQVKGMVFAENYDNPEEEPLPDVTIAADTVVKSIGYRTVRMAGVPFDEKTSTIPNDFGCVVDKGQTQLGLYVAGWAKRGPVGIIDATLRDAKETFGIIRHHLQSDQLRESDLTVDEVMSILPKSAVTYK